MKIDDKSQSKALIKTRQDAVIIFCMLFSQFMAFMALTIPVPFFPIEVCIMKVNSVKKYGKSSIRNNFLFAFEANF